MKSFLHFWIVLLFLFTSSCSHKAEKKDTFRPSFSSYKSDSTATKSAAAKYEIFYGLLTPVEICSIFNRLGISYSQATLNPISNSDQYLSISKASINTGIYGVDFGYLKIFGIGQEMINYMVTIRSMSNKLGIPDKFLTEPIRRIHSDISDPDTIMSLMNDAYYKMEDHLRAGEGKVLPDLW